ENINARMGFLINGTSRQWVSDATVHGVERAFANRGLVPDEPDAVPEATVAARGIPVGMLHALGTWDEAALRADAATVTRLTHGGAPARELTTRVALATASVARAGHEDVPPEMPDAMGETPLDRRIASIVASVSGADAYEDAVLPVVRAGGETSAFGAIAGGIAGIRFGASGIPQHLIDDLDARIYLSMAAPWFFRTVLRRTGTVIDLRIDTNEFPG